MARFRVDGQLSLDGSGFVRTIRGAEVATNRFANSVRAGISSRLSTYFSLGFMAYGVRRIVDYASKLNDMAQRTSVSVEALQRLDKAAKDNSLSLEKLIAFWDHLNRSRNEALKNPQSKQSAAFRALGVSPDALATQTAENLMRTIALKFQTSSNIEGLIAPLLAVGGRGVGNLVGLFRAGLDQMYKDMSVMTSEQAYQLDTLAESFDNLARTMAADLAPGLVNIIGYLRHAWNAFKVVMEGLGHFLYGIFTGRNFKELDREWKDIARGMAEKDIAALEEEKEKMESAIRRRNRPAGLEFSPFELPEAPKASARQSIQSDALVAVGNFLGSGSNMLNSLARQQVVLQREIASNTKETVNLLRTGSQDSYSEFE